MKKMKLFFMSAVMMTSLACLTVVIPAQAKKQLQCVSYTIICDAGFTGGSACGYSTQEIFDLIWDLSVDFCGY